MLRVEATWIWKTLSPMHCGSGQSVPGYADRLVQRDRDGNPALVGDAVKGALRLSAEQLLAWLNYKGAQYNTSSHLGTAEPQHALLIVLFGGVGHQHYSPGKLLKPEEVKMVVTAATAIHRKSGRADDNTLRHVESVAAGVRFKCQSTFWLENEMLLDPSITLLLAAIAATESIGAKAGIGWGRVQPEEIKVFIHRRSEEKESAEPVDLKAALGPERLDQLASTSMPGRAPEKNEHVSATGNALVAAATAASSGHQWWKLTLTLEEPVSIGSRPDVSNKVATLDSFPAPALRGAIGSACRRAGIPESQILQWLNHETRWTPAFPGTAVDRAIVPCVPTPLSFSRVKEERGFGTLHGIHDALSGCEPLERDEKAPEQRLQWRPVGEGWTILPLGKASPPDLQPLKMQEQKEMRMHVARDYVTGSKRTGALFAREALSVTAENRGFVAYMRQPANVDVPSLWPTELFLGKRRSAGNGRARVAYERVGGPWPRPWASVPLPSTAVRGTVDNPIQADIDVLVQALTPMILRDSHGFLLRALGKGDWERLLLEAGQAAGKTLPAAGILGDVLQRAATRPVPGWMMTWNHGRAAVTTITSGSVWRLRCMDAATAMLVRSLLSSLASGGVGERNHEGFGWIAVDPPWLGHWSLAEGAIGADGSSEPKAQGSRRDWPGCKDVPTTLVVAVRNAAPGEEARSPLQDIATRAREDSADINKILKNCTRMADRKKGETRWGFLQTGKPARKILDDYKDNRDLFRFALEAMLICATPEKEASE